MSVFEYKVVAAPVRGLKGKGIKGTQARFANALQTVMNDLAKDGWEYQRTDTLPLEERQGLTGKSTTFQNMLVFRRALTAEADPVLEVAALIEDQTGRFDKPDTTPANDICDPVVEDAPLAAQSGNGDTPLEAAEPAADTLELNANNRVNETLKAPFTFPWNRRDQAGKPATSDDDQATAP